MKYTTTGPSLYRATSGSAGYDLFAHRLVKTLGDVMYFSTGISVAVPMGYVGDVHERSSLHKKNYSLVNSVGVIDSDYRGEIIIGLKAHPGSLPIEGERVAQLVIKKIYDGPMDIADTTLPSTHRGDGGFGSTG